MAPGIALLVLSAGVNAQEHFVLQGRLAADSNGTVRLTYYKGRRLVTDSAKVTAGRFSFAGTLEAPCEATLVRNPAQGRISYEQYIQQDAQEFYLAPGDNILESSAGVKKATISNNGAQADYLALKLLRAGFDEKMEAARVAGQQAFEAKNDSALQRIKAVIKTCEQEKEKAEDEFIQQHPDSDVAFDMLQVRCTVRPVNTTADAALYAVFSKRIQQSVKGKALGALLQQAQLLSAGHTAPDFTLLDTTGQPVTLSSLRGKYVLLCFWHAQSMGTSAYAEAIKLLHKQHQRQDLLILSVGYVSDWEMWTGMLQRQQLPGIHVVDLNGVDMKGNQSETAKAYGLTIGSFPQCFLLDKNGTILARHPAFNNQLAANILKLIP
ncbi:hypothetical protein GCM10011379_10620 [Filimonas zeae]|uniref:Thioredoxin domain-containing protein n=2 Tax=Filimonas zeae TaxID=1737353 RepID=A0A917IST7_9BACT|nr:hypothetical protein GCM10011379_10620 [Filimonas zeae]